MHGTTSRWPSLRDLVRIVRSRVAAKNGNYHRAVQLLDVEPEATSSYYRFIPLYRLTLMVVTKDPRRTAQALELLGNQWPVESDEDRWFETYRRYLCFGILSDHQKSGSAKRELSAIPVPRLVASTIGVPG